jgi:N-methylhydantoinase A
MVDELSLNDYHLTLPSVDIHSISGGGGTIASVDRAGLLHVGPHGAGARPGPACYGLGGADATVTDAHVVLGRLKSGGFANGLITLDDAKAREAIERNVARPLGVDAVAAAAGVIQLLEQSLQHALEQVSIEKGHDPRRFTLVAGGGAGALHAASVARAIGCPSVYVPRLAGVFCAFGMCGTDIRQDFRLTWLKPLRGAALDQLGRGFAELEAAAQARLADSGFALSEVDFERGFELRYVGQQWPIQVPAPVLDVAQVRTAFEERHTRQFGHHQPDGEIEIVHLRLAGIGRLNKVPQPKRELTTVQPLPRLCRSLYIDARAGFVDVPIYDGNALRPGHLIAGPALIEERNTTILIGPGDCLQVDAFDNFTIQVAQETAA